MVKLLALFLFLASETFSFDLSSMLIGAGSKMKSFFTDDSNFQLKKVKIVAKKEMNSGGAVNLHIVIVYDKELQLELSKMTSTEYFSGVEQLKKDHPDRLYICKWEIVAKDRIFPDVDLKIPREFLIPLDGFVFVSYNNTGPHRGEIPPARKRVTITLEDRDFKIEGSDDEDDEDKEDEEDDDGKKLM